ncbi:hypothetical protein [Pseudobacter ginsenosidimutans]|uniref:DUF4397 domain-containing protein n=1 Tax=Pseudobacter ginsenosidimutans TaxID=661488 RepID=A0A4Q7ML23_9BACT|nr:hypothetical protein [Pseudobacter ginsenosidimutans]QEC40389.1 DUF4397 domain-containing protein [Pseudobacter ginsenosidimutans]RZS69006.1 hypothetical protein EV199_4830 [Pseudobacter ginsenosidimutans]
MKQIISGILLSMLFIACSKQEPVRPGSTSLVLFHGVAGANNLRTSFSDTAPAFYYLLNNLTYANFHPMANIQAPVAGKVPLHLYQLPDTMPKAEPLFKLELDLPAGSMHSLFLTGTPDAPDYVLVKDEPLPLPRGDSAMGIRFVNLMNGDIPVSINLTTKEEGSEAMNLPFKGVTSFKKYEVKSTVADYVFEFRNANTGVVLATYTTTGIANDGKLIANAWVYKNFALALVGVNGATGVLAPKIIKINYARV